MTLPSSIISWKNASMMVLLAAMLIRICIYLDARDLMIDEANLAFNIIDRDYVDVFRPLDHEQYAPPLFLVLEKITIRLGGIQELSLRLVPLLFSFFFLWWFRQVSLRLTNDFWTLWAMLPAGFSWYFLRYSTEVKQYSSDMAIAVGLVYLALLWPASTLSRTRLGVWSIIGAMVIWLSMPAVFILAGIGVYYLWCGRNTPYRQLMGWLVPAIIWSASFITYYVTILQHDIGLDKLQTYHSRYFLRLDWWNPEVFAAQYQLLMELNAVILPPFPLMLLVTAIGLISLLWTSGRSAHTLLLLFPVAATLLASGIQSFSLIPRVSLFLFPLILLLIASGWRRLSHRLPISWQTTVCIVLLLIAVRQMNITYYWKPLNEEPIRQAIRHIQEHEIHRVPVIIHHEAAPAFRFYTQYHKNRLDYQLPHALPCPWDSTQSILLHQINQGPCWLLAAHTDSAAIKLLLSAAPAPMLPFEQDRAYAYYWP